MVPLRVPGLYRSNGCLGESAGCHRLRAEIARGQVLELVPTDPKGRFEALFRFCGPEKPLLDKRWVLPDIEKIG
jgi:hypothetical protein